MPTTPLPPSLAPSSPATYVQPAAAASNVSCIKPIRSSASSRNDQPANRIHARRLRLLEVPVRARRRRLGARLRLQDALQLVALGAHGGLLGRSGQLHGDENLVHDVHHLQKKKRREGRKR